MGADLSIMPQQRLKVGDLRGYNSPGLIFMVILNVVLYFLVAFIITAYYTW